MQAGEGNILVRAIPAPPKGGARGASGASNAAPRAVPRPPADPHRATSEQGAPLHRAAHRREWPWLPLQHGSTLAPHPYCSDCGLVRFVGSSRARDLGGLANLIARLEVRMREQGMKITEAQRRLIVKRLEAQDAVDTFGLSRQAQERLLAEAVGKYTGLSPEAVASYLCSC